MPDFMPAPSDDASGGRDETQPRGTTVRDRPWWRSHAGLALALAVYAYVATVLSAAAYLSIWTPTGAATVDLGRAIVWQALVYGLWVPLGLGLLVVLRRCATVRSGLILFGALTLPGVVLHAVLASAVDVLFSPKLEWPAFGGLVAARLPIDIALWTMIAAALLALIWRERATEETEQVKRLRQALADARRANTGDERPSRIPVSVGRRRMLVDPGDVERFGSAANYVVVHWADNEGLIREPLRNLEQRLDPRRFMRVHRSSVVNLAHVVDAAPLDDGSWRLRMTSGAEVILSRSYRDAFLERVGMRPADSATPAASN